MDKDLPIENTMVATAIIESSSTASYSVNRFLQGIYFLRQLGAWDACICILSQRVRVEIEGRIPPWGSAAQQNSRTTAPTAPTAPTPDEVRKPQE